MIRLGPRTQAALAAAGMVVVVVVACCGGAVLLVNGGLPCGLARPGGVTMTDLAGTYAEKYGTGHLALNSDGTVFGDDLRDLDYDVETAVSSPGFWALLPSGSSPHDIIIEFTISGDYGDWDEHLGIGGSRDNPYLYRNTGDPTGCHQYQFLRS